MEVKGRNILITGATGGIGGAIALVLAERGARQALLGRNEARLAEIKNLCEKKGGKTISIEADLTEERDIIRSVEEAESQLGPLDILINNAGVMSFNSLVDTSDKDIRNVVISNIYSPVRLTREVLPKMMERQSGLVVNIGSIFGSLSFPCFSVYSASKCAVRGFSEALRRELVGSGLNVCYIAPRGTKTSQSDTFLEMARETGMNLDEPEKIGKSVVDAIEMGKRELFIGGPESFFVFLNKFFPSLIDKALKKKVEVMRKYSKAGQA